MNSLQFFLFDTSTVQKPQRTMKLRHVVRNKVVECAGEMRGLDGFNLMLYRFFIFFCELYKIKLNVLLRYKYNTGAIHILDELK